MPAEADNTAAQEQLKAQFAMYMMQQADRLQKEGMTDLVSPEVEKLIKAFNFGFVGDTDPIRSFHFQAMLRVLEKIAYIKKWAMNHGLKGDNDMFMATLNAKADAVFQTFITGLVDEVTIRMQNSKLIPFGMSKVMSDIMRPSLPYIEPFKKKEEKPATVVVEAQALQVTSSSK